jgi:hypothetical protein
VIDEGQARHGLEAMRGWRIEPRRSTSTRSRSPTAWRSVRIAAASGHGSRATSRAPRLTSTTPSTHTATASAGGRSHRSADGR